MEYHNMVPNLDMVDLKSKRSKNQVNQKYKLVDRRYFEDINKTLYQIEALYDFGYVKKGERGGWIESESNLDAKGNAWICENAKVYGNARVFEDAEIFEYALVFWRH